MKWRVVVELAGADGTVQSHEISAGGCGTIDDSGNAGADTGGRQKDPGRAATPPGSGALRSIAATGDAASAAGLNVR